MDTGWHPLREMRYRPITTIIVGLIGLYMIWFGSVLIGRPKLLTDPHLFSGPLLFWDLQTWGVIYIVLGVVKLGRLFLLQYAWVSRVLHFFPMVVLTLWAVALNTSPLTLLQPATTLIAILCGFNPWITNIIMRSGEAEYLLSRDHQR